MTARRDKWRKAAILVDALDPPTADALLERMPPEAAARVRRAVMELDRVDAAEREIVLREFFGVPAAAETDDDGGIELDDSLAARFAPPSSAGPQRAAASARPAGPEAERPGGGESPPFRFLHEAETDWLWSVLRGERPQLIAVVAAHLPPQRAAELVVRLDPEQQADVLQRIAALAELDPHVLQELEREMEDLLADRLRSLRRRSSGVAAVQAILQAADGRDRRELLDRLASRDRRLAQRLEQPPPPAQEPPPRPTARPAPGSENLRRAGGQPATPPPLAFNELERLDDASLLVLLQAADPQTALLALTGASSRFVERILAQLPGRWARRIRRDMERLGPLQLRDVERAQQALADLAQQLAARGRIAGPPGKRFAAAA